MDTKTQTQPSPTNQNPVVGIVVPAGGTKDNAAHSSLKKVVVVQAHGKPFIPPANGWVLDKTFEAGSLQVQVKRRHFGQRVAYSVDVGEIRNNAFSPHLTPAVTDNGALAEVRAVGMTVARLLDEAYVYVQGKVQEQLDRQVEAMQRRELRDMERQGVKLPEDQVTKAASSEKELAKRKRHEDNVARRRQEDAEFRSKTKGKGK